MENINQSLIYNKNAIKQAQLGFNQFTDFLQNYKISQLSYKTLEKILLISIEKNYFIDFLSLIDNYEIKNKLLFNAIIDDNQFIIDNLPKQDLINFLNKTDDFFETNLTKIIQICSTDFSNKLLKDIFPYKNDLIFDNCTYGSNILNAAFSKNVENISLYFNHLKPQLFNSKQNQNIQPINSIKKIDISFLDKIIDHYLNNNLQINNYSKYNDLFSNFIKYNSIDHLDRLFEKIPNYENKSLVDNLVISFLENKKDFIYYFIQKYNLCSTTKNNNYSDLDILWFSCKFYKNNEDIFDYLTNNISNLKEYADNFLPKTTQEIDSNVNNNLILGLIQSNDNEKQRRNYTELLAEYGDIGAIKKLKDKGVFLIDNPHTIYSSAFKDKINQDEKFNFFKEYVPLPLIEENNMFEHNSFSSFKKMKKSILLSFLDANKKDNITPKLINFISENNLKLSKLDYATIMTNSIKNSNDSLFKFCKKHLDINEYFELCNQIIDKESNSMNLMFSIKNINNKFIQNNKEDILNFITLLTNSNNDNYGELYNNLFLNTDFFNLLISNKNINKSTLIQHMASLYFEVSDKSKFIKAMDNINPQFIKQFLETNTNLKLFLTNDISKHIDNLDISKIDHKLITRLLISINSFQNKNTQEEKNIAAKQISYLIDKGYNYFFDSYMLAYKINKELLFKILDNNSKPLNFELSTPNEFFCNNINYLAEYFKKDNFKKYSKENIQIFIDKILSNINNFNSDKKSSIILISLIDNYSDYFNGPLSLKVYNSCQTLLNSEAKEKLFNKFPNLKTIDEQNSNSYSFNPDLLFKDIRIIQKHVSNYFNLNNLSLINKIIADTFIDNSLNNNHFSPRQSTLMNFFDNKEIKEHFLNDSKFMINFIKHIDINKLLLFVNNNEISEITDFQFINKLNVNISNSHIISDFFIKLKNDDYYNEVINYINNQPKIDKSFKIIFEQFKLKQLTFLQENKNKNKLNKI